MNWDDLRFVLAIARHRTLLGAGKALAVTHTTAGRRLRNCETDLGVRLFDRTPDGLVPTPAGQELIGLAEQTENEVLAAESRILGKDLKLTGALRVSTFDGIYPVCHDAFASFFKRYPSVNVTLTTPSRSVSLSRREADVAVRLSGSPPPGLIGKKVGTVSFGIYASPALVERVGAGAALSDFPWLSIDERLPDAPWHKTWLKKNAPGARVAARVDENQFVIRRLIQSSVGVYFLPIIEGDALGLLRVGDAPDGANMPVWLLTLPDLRRNSRVRAFLDHMSEALPPLLEDATSTTPERAGEPGTSAV